MECGCRTKYQPNHAFCHGACGVHFRGKTPVLVEIAPGIDLERDILAHMDFVPEISPDLKVMDSSLFEEAPFGLISYL